MKTLCFYNHKGGVGKTTVSAAVCGEIASRGKKVLLVDADSQANLTSLFCEPKIELADCLFNARKPEIAKSAVVATKYEKVWIVPSKRLSTGGRIDEWARGAASEAENRDAERNFLREMSSFGFDFTIIDMSPSFSEFDKKILLASDEVVPVMRIDTFSIDGIKDFYILLEKLKAGDEKPNLKRFVFNCKDKRTAIQRILLPEIEKIAYKKHIIPTDTVFEKAKALKKMVQAMGGMKKETREVLAELASDIMGE